LSADIAIQPGDIVISLSREGRIVHVNKEAAATFGYTVEQMVGVPIEVVCPRINSGAVRFDIEAIMAGRGFVGGFECARRDGTPLSLYMYATAGSPQTPDGAGEEVVAGVLCVAREVTAFWQAEEAVRASREKYRLLFDLSPDMVILTTTDGRIVEANQAVSLLSGYSTEQLKRMSILDLVPARTKRKAELVFAGLWHRKQLKSVLGFQTSDGRAVVVEFNASVSRIDGRPMVFAIGRDVSGRVQVERQAEEIGEKYERVFDAIRDGVYLETMDGRILDVNAAACDQLGYSREELLKKSAADLVPAEARAWLPNIREALLRQGDLLVDAVNVRKDGTELPVEVRCSRMELGGRTLVLVMARDISERRESERAIKQSEEQLRTLQNNVPVGIFRTDPEGKLLMVNATAVRMYGYESSEEMLARSARDLYADPAEHEAAVRRLMRDRGLTGLEVEMKRKDGTKFWGLLDVGLVTDESNGARFFDGTVQNVTDRKLAESALRGSEENFRALAENANDGILIALGDGRYVYANRRASEITGYSVDELLEVGMPGLAHPDERAGLQERLQQRLQGKEPPRQYETSILTKDNRRVSIELTAALTEWHGESAAMVVLRDISERKLNEQNLQEERDRAQSYLDVAGAMMVALDANGRISLANRAACEVLDYTAEEIVGADWFETCLPEEVRDEVRTVHGRLIAGKAEPVRTFRNPILTKTGESRTVEWTNAVLTDPQGRIVGTLSSGTDVTERLQSERALRESEEKYRNVVQHAQDGIAVVLDGKLAFVNPALLQMTGFTEDELIGTSFVRHVPEGQRPALIELYSRRLAGKHLPSTYETAFEHSDGHHIDIEVSANVVGFEGQVADLVFIRDITGRKRIARELAESHRSLTTLISNLPGMAYRCSNDKNWTMEFVSQGVEDLTGFRPEEVVNNEEVAFGALIHPMDRMLIWDEVQAAIRNREPFELTYRITTRSGRIKWVWEQGRGVFDEDGRLLALEGFVTDITDRKAAEEEVRESLEALRESKQRYSTLFMGTPIGLYRTTPDGRILMASPAMVEMLGYGSFSELQSRNLEQDGFHPGYSRQKFKLRVELEGEITGFESEWTRKDGSTIFVRENARVVRAEDGEVLYYEGTVEDITAVRESLRALRDSEARLSLMVKQLPAVLWTVDVNLVFTSSVGAGLAALGLEPGQVVGISLFDYFNTKDPEFPAIAAHRRALEGQTAEYGFEWSGNVYQNRVEPLLDSDGRIVGAIGIAHDVTARTRAEQRTGVLLQSVPRAVVHQTGGGTEYVSPNVGEMLGYAPDEFLRDQMFFPGLIHPEDKDRVADNFARWLKGGGEGVLTQEFRVRRKDGEFLWVADHVQLAYRTEDGKTSTLGVLVDITGSRRS
jgi:PAS domain S-box-containing protein